MKLDRLKSFLLVAEESNLTRAAARRHTTPSAVSDHLRQLEDELELALFERSKRGMRLTAAGEQLLMPARQVFSAVEDLRNTALSLRSTPRATLRLGLNSPPEYLRIDQILRRKATALPHLNLEMRTRSSRQILGMLLGDELDLGYVYGDWSDERLAGQTLAPVEIAVAGPADAPFEHFPDSVATRRALPWIWPTEECPFHEFMTDLLGSSVAPDSTVTRSDDEYSTVAMVRTGLGFGLLERDFADQVAADGGMRVFPEPRLTTWLSLVCPARGRERAELRALFDLIVEEWQH